MQINTVLSFVAAAIMFFFTISVLQRWHARHNLAFLFWGIGLFMFGVSSLSEAYLAIRWSPVMFAAWYLCGAVLTAAWLGQGTLYLLFKKWWVHVVSVILIIGSVFVLGLIATTTLDSSEYDADRTISETYTDIMPDSAPVRMTSPIFNIYGMLTLVGGAIYSAYLFWRKRVLPNRVIGNIMIAVGALSIGLASTLTRTGYGEYLYLGELTAAILMYLGFRMAAGPK